MAEPGREFAPVANFGEPVQRIDERLLGHILGIVGIAERPVGSGKYLLSVALRETLRLA